jgi:DNA-binding beta-propeller fold protein YncE
MRTSRSRAAALSSGAASIVALLAFSGCASDDKRPEKPIVFPLAPDAPRVQFLRKISSSDDLEKPSWFRRIVLGAGADEGRVSLGKPYAAAFRDGKVYVCDGRGALVFDLAAKTSHLLDPEHMQFLPHPVAMAIADDGTKYFADIARKAIVVYDKDDNYVTALGDPSAWKPVGVAVTDERVYGLDIENSAVQVFDRRTGARLGGFGGPGPVVWNLNRPTAIATDKEGNVYVTDSFNFRLNKYDSTGRYLRSFGESGRDYGKFGRPRGVAVDREGRIYVVDASFNAVQIFDKEGHLLLAFGELGNAPGNMYLPSGITISYDAVSELEPYVAKGREIEYAIVVVNQFGPNGLSIYGFLKQPAGQRDDVAPVSTGSIAPVSSTLTATEAPSSEMPAAEERKPGVDVSSPDARQGGIDVPEDWFSDAERARRAAARRQRETGAAPDGAPPASAPDSTAPAGEPPGKAPGTSPPSTEAPK